MLPLAACSSLVVAQWQARNFIRDKFRVGDVAFFYHSVRHLPATLAPSCVWRSRE
jgi:hypothetical protein